MINIILLFGGYSSKNSLDRLYKYQKKIGRIIFNDFTSSATDIFEIQGWLTIYERRDFITLNQVYKCLYEHLPVPLQRLFYFRNNQRQLPLRNTGIDLNIPIAKMCLELNVLILLELHYGIQHTVMFVMLQVYLFLNTCFKNIYSVLENQLYDIV